MQIRAHLGGLPTTTETPAGWDALRLQEAHSSTSFAGNALSRHDVEELLNNRRAVGNHLLADYLEVTGYADAVRWVHAQAHRPSDEQAARPVTLTEIRNLHRLALRPAWHAGPPDTALDTVPGTLRARDLRPFAGWLRTPAAATVEPRLREWLDEVNDTPSSTPELVEQVAVAHTRFEQLHPFVDGNGRVGRLLVNLLLVRRGYAPVRLAARDHARYVHALHRSDTGDHALLALMFARSILDGFSQLEAAAQGAPAPLVRLSALERPGTSRVALRNAAQRGRLRAERGDDGHWRSCATWVDDYLADKYVRDPADQQDQGRRRRTAVSMPRSSASPLSRPISE